MAFLYSDTLGIVWSRSAKWHTSNLLHGYHEGIIYDRFIGKCGLVPFPPCPSMLPLVGNILNIVFRREGHKTYVKRIYNWWILIDFWISSGWNIIISIFDMVPGLFMGFWPGEITDKGFRSISRKNTRKLPCELVCLGEVWLENGSGNGAYCENYYQCPHDLL